MDKNLPARPNLDQLRSQAKTLLSRLQQGDPAAAETFIRDLPAAKGMTPDEALAAGFRLADAQSAIARSSGFANWPSLARHVELLRSFEGSWEFVDLEVDGSVVPTAALAYSRLLMDGDRFRMESPEATYEGIFNIDVEAKPHHIDIEFIEGPEAGNWSYGIFELEGDALKLCLTVYGAVRPTEFATSPESGHALENLRRSSKSRPVDVKGGPPKATQEIPVDPAAFENAPVPPWFEGEWKPLEITMNGQVLPPKMLATGSRMAAGNETKVVFGGQTILHAKVRIDESFSPAAIDYMHLTGTAKGRVTLGIIERSSDEVSICMSSPGDPRPEGFASELGSNRTLSRWATT